MISAGEPLIREAIAALRTYRNAEADGAPAEEVARLRLIAESAFQAVTDYELYSIGHQPLVRH
ncbi:hypothetical protein [Pseudomonas muyukensis]